jgi:hypothetical protein
MPKKITSLTAGKREKVLAGVKALLLQNQFSDSIASWLCDNINHIDE